MSPPRQAETGAARAYRFCNHLPQRGQLFGACGSAQVVVGVPDDVGIDAGAVTSELAQKVGGGGPPDFAQGGGPNVDALDDALEDAPEVLRETKAGQVQPRRAM